MEIEIKFEAAEAGLPAAVPQALVSLGAEVSSPERQAIVDRYLDTDDWWFYRAGAALRVRVQNGQPILTLKTLTPPKEGVASRMELEECGSSPPPDSTVELPDGPLAEWMNEQCGQRPFRLLFQLRNDRTEYDVTLTDGGRVKVCVDKGNLHAGGRALRFREIELELRDAALPDVKSFASRLAPVLDLQPSDKSKFSRGLVLADLSWPKRPKGREYKPQPSDRVVDSAYRILRHNFRLMLWNEPGTRLGLDPEFVHDMRVSIRRLRAAFGIFSKALPKKKIRKFEKEVKWIADKLGRVRDLDVHLERLDVDRAHNNGNGDDTFREVFREWLWDRRNRARTAALRMLDSRRYAKFIDRFGQFLSDAPPQVPSEKLAERPITDTALHWVESRLGKVMLQGKALSVDSGDEDYHRLRIQCKKLRYVSEFFRPLYGSPLKKFVKHLAKLQDVLGTHQDASTTTDTLDLFREESRCQPGRRVDAGIGDAIASNRQTTHDCRERFFEAWESFETHSAHFHLQAPMRNK